MPDKDTMHALALAGGMILAAAALLIAWMIETAQGHDWYPPDCCSGCDCRPVAAEDVRVTAGGWLVVSTGEVIGFHDGKLRPSRDGGFHRCSPAYCKPGAADRTICLFAPGMGS